MHSYSFRWYFAVISMSGVFAVTFSVVFAYVADITQEHERSTAYGLVRSAVTLCVFLNASRIIYAAILSEKWCLYRFLFSHFLFCSASRSLQVSATFAASLVTSPAIGAYLSVTYGDTLVVILATAIALLDICFILVAVPESLPEKMRPASWGAPISWEQADPFSVSNNITHLVVDSIMHSFLHKRQLIECASSPLLLLLLLFANLPNRTHLV